MAEQIVSKRHNWPRQPTTFIGRAAELSQVRTRLLDPACCLLTVLGPGGIGKTRLAVQAAGDLPAHFEQGVYFVPLQGVASGEFLVLAIAEAVNFTLSGSQPPLTQVLNYLGNKTMLLVLDNFEQLIGQDGRMILLEILAAVPTIKLLVTSREALNLQEEWLFPLQGLPVPDSTQPRPIDADGAVALFTARAQQVRPDFSAADEAAEVLRICRLIEGVPLAVELAASWTKTLNCGAIADEIARSLDFLVTRLHNLPDRHRSMAAVFDYSWQRLSETEQQVFQRLSVFRGGFRRDAAVQVAGASLGDLAALVDKSLLRREVDDRYQLHELLRQYAEAQLAAQPEAMHRTRQAHCAYYAEFLSQRSDAIESGDQRSTVAEITAELDNVRAAWQWAIEQVQVSAIQKLTHTFTVFCHYQSHYLEAANTFEQVRACLANLTPDRQTTLALAEVLVRLGWFRIRLGEFEAAQSALNDSRTLFTQLGIDHIARSGADPLPPLSILATIRGDYAEAVALGRLAQQRNEKQHDRQNLAFSHYVLTSATLAQGDYETARQHAQKSCEVARQAGNRWFLAYCLNEWGNVARAMGDLDEARQHFQESYRIRESFDDPEGMAVALNHLGEIAIRQADFPTAEQHYQQSLTLYQEINDRGGLAMALNGLGQTACVRPDYAAAAHYFQQALTIAADIQFLPFISVLGVSISDMFFKVGQVGLGLELLSFVREQRTSEQETKDRAEAILQRHHRDLDPAQYSRAVQLGRNYDLEMMMDIVQKVLAAASHPSPNQKESFQAEAPPRLDPLTERELDVLRLMAAGHSNREIGEALVLAVGSVKWYASQIYSKLQVKNRTEAAAKARALDLL